MAETTQVIHLPGISRLCKTMKENIEPEVVPLIYNKIGDSLPAYVSGIYLRTGPGDDMTSLFDFEDFGSMKHLFDGYAMLTKFDIDAVNNSVSLTKRFLQSESYKRAMAASKPVIAEFATAPKSDPHQSFFSKVVHTLSPEFTDNNSSNITMIGRDIYTFGDTCYFREVDPVNLTCKEKCDTNKLFNLNFQCAHPLTDSCTGDVWNIGVGYSIFTGLKFNIFKMPAAKTSQEMFKSSKIVATIHSRWSSSISPAHSFGMTKNFIILIEQPFVVSVSKIVGSIIKKNAIYETMEWNAKEKNRFVVISKSGNVQQIEYYAAKTFHYLHVLNSYEDPEYSQIVIDIITYPSPSYLNALYVSKLRNDRLEINGEASLIQRFIIPILDEPSRMDMIQENINLVEGSNVKATAIRQGNTIILTPEPLAEKGLDMAVVSPAVAHRNYNFFYAASILSQTSVRNKIYKINTNTKEAIWWKQDDFTFLVGEPKFIPDPQAKYEEDGVLLCPIIDLRTENRDFLLFLDKDMKEICRASFKQDLPIAFHGVFVKPQNYNKASSSGIETLIIDKRHARKGEHSKHNN